MRISVPSKEVRVKAVELPATAAARVDRQPAGGRQVAERTAPEAEEAAGAGDETTRKLAVNASAPTTMRPIPSHPR
jgi:hypothetical protein